MDLVFTELLSNAVRHGGGLVVLRERSARTVAGAATSSAVASDPGVRRCASRGRPWNRNSHQVATFSPKRVFVDLAEVAFAGATLPNFFARLVDILPHSAR
jgi:hypothetical protein